MNAPGPTARQIEIAIASPLIITIDGWSADIPPAPNRVIDLGEFDGACAMGSTVFWVEGSSSRRR